MEQVIMERLAWVCPLCGTANAPHSDQCGCVADTQRPARTNANGTVAVPAKLHATRTARISSKSFKALPQYTSDFDLFWENYPRKKDKAPAFAAFARAVAAGVDPQTLIAGALRYRNDPERPSDLRFNKFPATWINACAWEDVPGVIAPPSAVAASIRSAEELAAEQQRRRDDEDERIAAYLEERADD